MSWAFGIPAASSSLLATGVAGSSAPAITKVGAVMFGSWSRPSYAASASQHAAYPSGSVVSSVDRRRRASSGSRSLKPSANQAVGKLGGVAGGDGLGLAEHRRELGQGLARYSVADSLVARELGVWHLHHRGVVRAVGPRLGGPMVARAANSSASSRLMAYFSPRISTGPGSTSPMARPCAAGASAGMPTRSCRRRERPLLHSARRRTSGGATTNSRQAG